MVRRERDGHSPALHEWRRRAKAVAEANGHKLGRAVTPDYHTSSAMVFMTIWCNECATTMNLCRDTTGAGYDFILGIGGDRRPAGEYGPLALPCPGRRIARR